MAPIAVVDGVAVAGIFAEVTVVHFPLIQLRPAEALQSPCLFPCQSIQRLILLLFFKMLTQKPLTGMESDHWQYQNCISGGVSFSASQGLQVDPGQQAPPTGPSGDKGLKQRASPGVWQSPLIMKMTKF